MRNLLKNISRLSISNFHNQNSIDEWMCRQKELALVLKNLYFYQTYATKYRIFTLFKRKQISMYRITQIKLLKRNEGTIKQDNTGKIFLLYDYKYHELCFI